jgi:hypothetical protein
MPRGGTIAARMAAWQASAAERQLRLPKPAGARMARRA